jgi:ABC-2 type transport system ATP-binding protein
VTESRTDTGAVLPAPALRVTGLRLSYGSFLAVDGIDLEVREGEIFGLLGPNGAGKTSALSAIEGLLRPAAGDIVIGNIDARAHPRQAKAQLGVQHQATSFHSNLTLLELVRLFAGRWTPTAYLTAYAGILWHARTLCGTNASDRRIRLARPDTS